MLANDAFHIAVIGGDGIGPEVMAPALALLRRVEETTPGLKFRFSETPAGATHYNETGAALPQKLAIDQGEAVGRPCRLGLEVTDARRILVSGRVVEIARGELAL